MRWWHVLGGDGDDGLPVRTGFEADPRLVRNPLWNDGSPRPSQPVGRRDGGREQYVRRKVSFVVPTNVLLTLDGERIDGGCSSGDPDALAGDRYYDFADRYLDYLDALAEDALMVRIRIRIRIRFHD
ncbi:hypothetical protein ACFZDG_13160 [Kitasatospora xanthocidica]|uniref:hypothetical protein n=1 Tax=Kitasatospora xanthocidica TaxID=83382 RepID=UPI0036EF762B